MPKSNFAATSTKSNKSKKGMLGKRPREGKEEEKKLAAPDESGQMFTKRLQKSKLKDLGKSLGDAIRSGQDASKIKDENR